MNIHKSCIHYNKTACNYNITSRRDLDELFFEHNSFSVWNNRMRDIFLKKSSTANCSNLFDFLHSYINDFESNLSLINITEEFTDYARIILFTPIYNVIIDILGTKCEFENSVLAKNNCEPFIKNDKESLIEFEKLKSKVTPEEKCKTLYKSLDGNSDLGSDFLLDKCVSLIIEAKIQNLYTEFVFIKMFFPEKLKNHYLHFCMTTLEASLSFIISKHCNND